MGAHGVNSKRCMALLLAGVFVLPGCHVLEKYLGGENGYLLMAYDTLALPGEKVLVRTRLEQGTFLRDKSGYEIQYFYHDRPYVFATTNDDGYAAVPFQAAEPGDYPLTVKALADKPANVLHTGEALVACRRADTPMVVLDLDKTLVASGIATVLTGEPEPMAGSAAVVRRLAEKYTIIYLTHRPAFLGPKSKAWLAKNGYPRGPVLLSSTRQFFRGSEQYKARTIKELRYRFTRLEMGFGDQPSDMRVYHDGGMRPFMILQLPSSNEPADYRELAAELEGLPQDTQVVTGWDQVEMVLDGKGSFPPAGARRLLLETAERLEKRQQ